MDNFVCNLNVVLCVGSCALGSQRRYVNMHPNHLSEYLSKDREDSCRNLCMRGHTVEHVAQTMESDTVNYIKR